MSNFPRFTLLNAPFLIWIVIDTGNANPKFQIQGDVPDLSLISTLYGMFLKPYLKTWNSKPIFRVFEETAIEKVVRQKVDELPSFLQDNDFNTPESDNTITLEGKDDTTVLEFVPNIGRQSKIGLRNTNDTFEANMRKYKKTRNKIYTALEEEQVSDKTKTLVMRTFDELLSKIIETQCNWQGETHLDLQNYTNKFIIPRTIVDAWNIEWEKLKFRFSKMTNNGENELPDNLNTLMSLLNNLDAIINDVIENLKTFTEKYKINCNISRRKHYNKNFASEVPKSVRNMEFTDEDDTNVCKYFKVCSKELKGFFIDFYNSLNDTAINVVRGYAEMFARDVYTDASSEKDSIVTKIFNIADKTEKEIIKIFVNSTAQFKLDDVKNIKANIDLLSVYIKTVIQNVKMTIANLIDIKLKDIPRKVYKSIQKDISLNLGIELGNLERDLIGKICFIFNVCNGNSKTRRTNELNKKSEDSQNKIYVKVELSIDRELEDTKKNSLTKISKSSSNNLINGNPNNFAYDENMYSMFFKKYENISVTRTTTL